MVLCGHVAGPNDWTASVGYQVSVNDAGKKVHEIVFNPQAMGGGWHGNGGDGYMDCSLNHKAHDLPGPSYLLCIDV